MAGTAPPALDGETRIEELYPGMQRVGEPPRFFEYLRQGWDRRDFAYTIALGQLRAENQNTVLGSIWHLLNPLMLAGVYYFVFGIILGGRAQVHDNYAAFLIVGIFVFHFSQKVIIGGTRVITANVDLIKNIRFPRALLPLASTIQETLAQLPALLAMGVIVFVTEWLAMPARIADPEIPVTDYVLVSWTGTGDPAVPAVLTLWWLLLVPLVMVQSVFNLGSSLIVARLTFHFRDTEFILGYIMRVLFYSSGVFFGVDLVRQMFGGESLFRRAAVFGFDINPFYGFIELTRQAVMEGKTEWWYWRNILIASVVAIVVGFVFFRRREMEYSRA